MLITPRRKKSAVKLLLAAAFLLVLGLAGGVVDGAPGFLSIRERNGRSLEFIQDVFQEVSPTVAYISSASLRLDRCV